MKRKNSICKDCNFKFLSRLRCPRCHSPRVLTHNDLFNLKIAHVDCDAFYASIEKSLRPELLNRPVIIGGGNRGVVTTCCYIARIHSIRSAMPIFKAKKLCPDVTILSPRMELYRQVSALIFAKMKQMTPMVETIALDEAYLDLSGTKQLHKKSPVELLLDLARAIEQEIKISISVGLSHNRFLSKIASSVNKPRGFTVIGEKEKLQFLENLPVGYIPGVGPSTVKSLKKESIHTFKHLWQVEKASLLRKYGRFGEKLWYLARGQDDRLVEPNQSPKSISKETTFENDVFSEDYLIKVLWKLSESISQRLKSKDLVGTTLTVKFKRSNFRVVSVTSSQLVSFRMAEDIFQASKKILSNNLSIRPLRLVGLNISKLRSGDDLNDMLEMNNEVRKRNEKTELVMDKIRNKYGMDKINKGRIF